MKQYWKYLSYVVRHKWFVLLAGLQLRVPLWRLVLHDWTKFLPCEWGPYVHWFYGGWRQDHYTDESDAPPGLKAAYDRAWCHHMHKNDHHWQAWIMVFDSGDETILPMSDPARREMLADWIGAGRALGKPDTRAWYRENCRRMRLHADTRAWVERQLEVISDDVIEKIADVQHQIWAHWMKYLLKVSRENDDGSVTIPALKAERWKRQLDTPYSDLSREEQYSDLEQADKVVAVLERELFR